MGWLTPSWTDALLQPHLACSSSGVPSCYSSPNPYHLRTMPTRLRLQSTRIFYRTAVRTREDRNAQATVFRFSHLRPNVISHVFMRCQKGCSDTNKKINYITCLKPQDKFIKPN